MADAEAQYAPLAQQAGAMQRQLTEAQAAAQASAAEAARLFEELSYYRWAQLMLLLSIKREMNFFSGRGFTGMKMLVPWSCAFPLASTEGCLSTDGAK
jgi:hypothetical protein